MKNNKIVKTNKDLSFQFTKECEVTITTENYDWAVKTLKQIRKDISLELVELNFRNLLNKIPAIKKMLIIPPMAVLASLVVSPYSILPFLISAVALTLASSLVIVGYIDRKNTLKNLLEQAHIDLITLENSFNQYNLTKNNKIKSNVEQKRFNNNIPTNENTKVLSKTL